MRPTASRLPTRSLPVLCLLASSAAPAQALRPQDSGAEAAAAEQLLADFPDVAAERGLTYINHSGAAEKRFILESHGAGVALLDLQTDGDLDVAFGQGVASLAALLEGPGADLEVFLNDGEAEFERAPGPGLSGWWTGLATGDVDGDGDTDLVAGAYGDLALLLQDGEGRLARHAEADDDLIPPGLPGARLVPGAEREVGQAPLWITALGLLDVNRDGYLDLYVGQHLDLDPLNPPEGSMGEGALELFCNWKGQQVYCGPHGLRAQPDRLLQGTGDGRFIDRTTEWLPTSEPAYTLALAAFDADGDSDTDLYIANDSTPNRMLINDGGRFLDVAEGAGVALNQDGEAEAGMGVAVGDVNLDGLPDMAVTNFSDEPTQLYFGSKNGFSAETFRWALAHQSKPLLSWGVHLTDFDGDGWLELFTGNGHVYPQADAEGTGTSYGQADSLWRLGSGGKARRMQPRGPDDLLASVSGTRGTAVGDLDGDGRPDLVVVRIDGPAALGLNRMGAGEQRLELRMYGPEPGQAVAEGALRTPADARGTRVTVHPKPPEGSALSDSLPRTFEVQTSASYMSASSPALYVGLGPCTEYDRIEIVWPTGVVGRFGPGKAGKRLHIRQGKGVFLVEDLPHLDAASERSAAEVRASIHAASDQDRAPKAAPRAQLGAAYPGDLVYAAPESEPADVTAARTALERDDLERVLELLTRTQEGRVLARFPDSPEALLALAQAFSRSGRPEAAAPLCERFVELAPLHPEVGVAWHILAMDARTRRDSELYRQRLEKAEKTTRLHDALPVRRAQILRSPGDPKPVLALAVAWAEADEVGRAHEILTHLVAEHADYARAWSSRALVSQRLGRFDEAVTDYKRALALDASNHASRVRLSALLFMTGAPDEGLQELYTVANSEAGGDPRFRAVHLNIARALLSRGEPDGAAESFARYRDLGGREPLVTPHPAGAEEPAPGGNE